ncbi:agmatinase [Salinisphaera hydrothermalis]|uniref:agmatinase n=1 Tax=Salinisphaera hydrothermalis TaxID=563188 RepID=UPI00333E7B10
MTFARALSGRDRFLGLGESELPLCNTVDGSRHKIAVLAFPLERTVSYGGGCADGPRAILEASKQVELLDHEYQCEAHLSFALDTHEIDVGGRIANVIDQAESHIAQVINRGCLPLVLGGEHTVSVAAVRAARSAFPEIAIVHFDAHLDLRDEYEGEAICHATAIRRCIDGTDTPLFSFGIRNESIEESEYRRTNPNVTVYSAKDRGEWRLDEFQQALGDRPVYLTIDLDCFDSSLMPATGTPEPGGLFWDDVIRVLETVAKHTTVVGADIVELAPIQGMHAPDFLASKLAYKVMTLSSLGMSPTSRSA